MIRPVVRRRAVRVLLVDDRDRLLLFGDRDLGAPDTAWWITPGGGVDPGETDLEAAVRELREETGLVVAADDLGRPLARRTVWHGFTDKVVRQEEVYVGLRVVAFEVDTSGHTQEELLTMTRHRWWTRAEIADTAEEVWPRALLDLWTRFDRGAPEVDLGEVEESTVPLRRRGPTGRAGS